MREHDSLETLKGVGAKSAALFSKCKIYTVGELAEYYPRYYDKFPEPKTFAELKEGEKGAVIASVHSRMTIKPVRGLKVCVMKVKDDEAVREIAWFNSPFLANVFKVNQKYIFVGEAVLKNGILTFQHPAYYKIDEYKHLQNTYQPVYSLTEGLTNNAVKRCVAQLKPLFERKKEYLSSEYLKENGLMSLPEAFDNIHFPKGKQQIIEARRRLVYHEFFRFLIYMDAMKEKGSKIRNHYTVKDVNVEDIINGLPYKLTSAQERTLKEIREDLSGPYVMNRLVQGDVGSGKTIIAILSLFMVVKSGYQGALMAPTEVLAEQHYKELRKMLEPYGIKVCLLTGTVKGVEKKQLYEAISNHEADIIVGTQALIQEKLTFADLALVITDEQHRFGVKQRERFAKKGNYPHVLAMSATPIPRTLAMMLYGDMSISVMDELPMNRLPVKNCVVGQEYRLAAIKFMKTEIEKGHQIYVICPMVNESETLEVENVTDYGQKLKEALPDAQIAVLHGKLKEAEKNEIMSAFARGETDILVSTTVIEVGINVPNATFMLIENAERFGLAALHQLRGRVGRGTAQSYCVFMYGKDTEKNKERLNVLNESNDGFEIARMDLEMRGPGDFFGIRQSGELDFKLGDIYQDAGILELAHKHLQKCKEERFDFSAYPELSWDTGQMLSI